MFNIFTMDIHVRFSGSSLNAYDIKYVRIDGTKSVKEREEAITLFTEKLNIRVCLLSLKSSGLGLNLTMGNHVFFLDPWWNPQMELQCIDRAHRYEFLFIDLL